MDKPVTILLLAANPKDTSQLRLDEEIREIDLALRRTEFRDRFVFKQHLAVRVSDLQEYFLRYRPDIVHFSGHGSESGEIMLENTTGQSQPVSSRSLGQIFSVLKDNIRCVVLNACYSDKQAEAIAQHIDQVIGMSSAISDQASIKFAAAFYQAVGFGRDLQTAFELGCLQIDLENLNEQNIPKSLSLNKDPRTIFLVTEAKKTAGLKGDAEFFQDYRKLFDRAAFRMPCIFERTLLALEDAVDDTLAAMATGALYSRQGEIFTKLPSSHEDFLAKNADMYQYNQRVMLLTIVPKSDFQTDTYRSTLERITSYLWNVRRLIVKLRNFLISLCQNYLGKELPKETYVMDRLIYELLIYNA
ncbi:MAG TPA: CHAT domain-containing protein, partial [Anaerolineales bacterium]|nr:CHAT domain-containing protein [Anaerolineales bacterium]